jgi:glycosyltransferase involved in cell wall biosynthesis
MKIAFFTPTHELSAIGRVSVLVRSALQFAGHDVALVATELDPLDLSQTNTELIDSTHWSDERAVQQIVDESDIVVHQIGDYYPYHAGSIHWLSLVGGCIALHDFFLGDMFLSWIAGHAEKAAEELQRWYGISVDHYLDMARSGRFVERTWPDYPLTEWVSSHADGIMAHSDFGLAAVRRATPAPVAVASLPYNLADAFGTSVPRPPRMADDVLRVLTFGRINSNKLCDDIISVIASDRVLRAQVEYRICGTIPPAEQHHLTSLAEDLGVHLTVTGELSDDDLAEELRDADLIACLRKPTLESASASAIEGMLAARPLVVVDDGFYASLPPEVAFKVPGRHINSGLRQILRAAVANEYDLSLMGAAAKAYAESTFRADLYASELVELGLEAARRKPLRELDAAYVSLRQTPNGLPELTAAAIYDADTMIFRP